MKPAGTTLGKFISIKLGEAKLQNQFLKSKRKEIKIRD